VASGQAAAGIPIGNLASKKGKTVKHRNAPSPAERVDSTSPAKKLARILFVWTAAVMLPLGASEAGG
jgi:hypothetical protein